MLNYVMSPTGRLLHESDLPVKMICGPYGSGKSCACAVDVLSYVCAQAPASDNVRYTRVGVIRSTYNELLTTTRKSLLEVFPAECGTITGGGVSPRGFYLIPLPDGTTAQVELNLIALASADDCEKLRSVNWTFAWINEATGVPPEVFGTVQQRVGRFPAADMGGVSWGGVILDFNMPPHGSWLYTLINNPPDNYLCIKQPPAAFEEVDEHGKKHFTINDNAENLRNLGAREQGDPEDFTTEEDYENYLLFKGRRYYRNQIDTLQRMGREDVIENQYCMIDVPIIEGKPVYSNFSYDQHVAKEILTPLPFHNIIIGMDQSGIHPAAVILQMQQHRWCVLDELYADGEGLEDFLNAMLLPLLRSKYSTCPVAAAIDPSNTKDSFTAITPKRRLEDIGIPAVTELTNSPKIRIQTVEHMLNLTSGGLLISPACEMLIRGFQSEYRYRRLRASGTIGAVYTPQPEKNEYSHTQDALQYAALLIQKGDGDDERMMQISRELAVKRRQLGRVL